MAQVTRTTNDVIINSLHLIGELGVGETPDAFMLSTGLELLNEIVDNFSVDNIYIPFLTTLSFSFVVGQGTYTISDITSSPSVNSDRFIDLEFANYTVSDIVYPLKIINKANYYGVTRLSTVQTRPAFIFMDKQATVTNVVVYPLPDQTYTCTIQVKSYIDRLIDQENLTTSLPPYYYGFLKYALARKFLNYYPSANWTPTAEADYQTMFENLKGQNETDLTIRPSTILSQYPPFYWQNILAY